MARFPIQGGNGGGAGAGGATEKIGEFDVTVAQATMPVTFTSAITPASLAEVIIIAEFQTSVVSLIKMTFAGLAGVSLRAIGMKVTGLGVGVGFVNNEVNLLGTGFNFELFQSQFMKVTLKLPVDGTPQGIIDESANVGSTDRGRRGTWIGDTTTGSITGVTLNNVSGLFAIGSSVRVYALKR